MEEIRRPQKEPASSEDGNQKVIDLTAEMEIGSEKGGKIYDLTQTLDGTVYTPPQTVQAQDQQPEESPPREQPQEETLEEEPMTPDESEPEEYPDIEEEVDAAFENIEPYSPIDLSEDDEEPTESDKVDDLKQMADDVLNQTSPASPWEDGTTAEPEAVETVAEPADADQGGPGMYAETEIGDGEDIIDLEDIAASPDIPPSQPAQEEDRQAQPDEEDIIELVDIASPPEDPPFQSGQALDGQDESEDEDIIDLMDVVPVEAVAAAPLEAPREPHATEDEEDLIVLVEIVSAAPEPDAEEGEVLEDLVELTDIAIPSDLPGPEDEDRNGIQDLSAGIGMVIEEQPAGISDEAIEAAIERYIRARYGGDLERMIAAVVEKAVSREIEILKHTYMDENESSE
ncbi:MAG: hypothetical protein P8X55_17990 [Desulfosarcinaceae bacterium]